MKKNLKYKIELLLFSLFLFVPLFMHATAQNDVAISLDFTNVPLGKVLNEIGRQTSLRIVYNTKDVNPEQLVSVKVNYQKLSSVMTNLLKNTNVAFTVKDNYLVLYSSKSTNTVKEVAQQNKRNIKGMVSDNFGEPLIGVSVLVKGTTTGVITDINGNYSIEIQDDNAILEFSYIGYQKATLSVSNATNFNVVLKEDTQVLSEVVVTAMGIEREAKSLTYATQTVKSEELTRIKEPNFINSLQGKSAGLLITPNNSGAGGGATKIVLRGQTSILGSNQPLIVLDGVPLSGGMGGQATDLMQGAGRDGGDLLSTLNPDDIASMTILKGPNAAALYGSSANNGVIIINTKSGEQGTVKVDVSSSTSVETLFMYPETQQIYGLSENTTLEAWGTKISEMTPDKLASQPYFTKNPRDPVKDFFNKGLTLNNGVTLSGGTEMARTYFSYNNTTQFGMVPKNKFSRHNFMFKESFSLFNKRLDISTSLNYIHQKTTNRPVTGRVLSTLHAVYRTPANVDMRYFRNHYKKTGTMDDQMVYDNERGNQKLLGQPIQNWYWYDQNLNNPYWVANMLTDEAIKDRILGNLTAKVKIWRNISYQTRFNVDMTIGNGLNTEYATMQRQSQGKGGIYWTGSDRSVDIYNDHMVTANERIHDKIDLNIALGASLSRSYQRSHSIRTEIDTAGIPNAFVPQNSKLSRPNNPNGSATSAEDSYDSKDWSTAMFATATVGLWDKIFIDGSYRMEWALAFQQFMKPTSGFSSFDYYSAGFNVLLDKLLPWDMPLINQMKLRGSWSVVGTPIPNQLFGRQQINFSDGSITSRPPIFEDPKPETTTSYEGGLEVWMLDNKLNFDLTYYNSTLKNQFMNVSTGSGETKPVNTGKIRNYGVEFSIGYRWAITSDFRWITGFNIAWNDNKIIETYKTKTGAPYIVTVGPNNFKVKYLEGGSYGDIYVNSFDRDKTTGLIKLNGESYADKVPVMTSGKFETFVGNTTAPVNFGWNNTFTWKNLSLYFLIDGKIGGKVMSLTQPDRDLYGLSERSANDRVNGERVTENGKEYVLKELPDGQKVSVENYYKTVGGSPMEDYVYDATNVRLRDLAVGYTFRNLFGDGRHLNASFTVKNVCFIYKNKNTPVDPDISQSTANGFSGIEAYSLPTTRSFGLNLKFNF